MRGFPTHHKINHSSSVASAQNPPSTIEPIQHGGDADGSYDSTVSDFTSESGLSAGGGGCEIDEAEEKQELLSQTENNQPSHWQQQLVKGSYRNNINNMNSINNNSTSNNNSNNNSQSKNNNISSSFPSFRSSSSASHRQYQPMEDSKLNSTTKKSLGSGRQTKKAEDVSETSSIRSTQTPLQSWKAALRRRSFQPKGLSEQEENKAELNNQRAEKQHIDTRRVTPERDQNIQSDGNNDAHKALEESTYFDKNENMTPASWKAALRSQSEAKFETIAQQQTFNLHVKKFQATKRFQDQQSSNPKQRTIHTNKTSTTRNEKFTPSKRNGSYLSDNGESAVSASTTPISSSLNMSSESGRTISKWTLPASASDTKPINQYNIQHSTSFDSNHKASTLLSRTDEENSIEGYVKKQSGNTDNAFSVRDQIMKFGGATHNAIPSRETAVVSPLTAPPSLKANLSIKIPSRSSTPNSRPIRVKTRDRHPFLIQQEETNRGSSLILEEELRNPDGHNMSDEANNHSRRAYVRNNAEEGITQVDDTGVPMAPPPSSEPPSPLAAAAANAAAELVRKSMTGDRNNSKRPPLHNVDGGVAANFLAAVNASSSTPSTPTRVSHSFASREQIQESSPPPWSSQHASLSLPSTPKSYPSIMNMSQDPFRFDISEDNLHVSPSITNRQSNINSSSSKMQNFNYGSKRQNQDNKTITDSTAGSNSVISRKEMEIIMDKKLRSMEDRIKKQMNHRMQELETNMELRMNEIHGLLMNLLENKVNYEPSNVQTSRSGSHLQRSESEETTLNHPSLASVGKLKIQSHGWQKQRARQSQQY